VKKRSLKVRDVMTPLVHTCRVEDPLERAAHLLWEHDCGVLPVVDAEGVVRSVITDRDICMGAYLGGRRLAELRVADSMSSAPVVCSPDEDLAAAAERMAAHQVRRLPVVDEAGKVQGLLSVNDMACASSAESASAVADPAAAGSLLVLMAASRHRGAETPETELEVTEIRPAQPPRASTTEDKAKGSKRTRR